MRERQVVESGWRNFLPHGSSRKFISQQRDALQNANCIRPTGMQLLFLITFWLRMPVVGKESDYVPRKNCEGLKKTINWIVKVWMNFRETIRILAEVLRTATAKMLLDTGEIQCLSWWKPQHFMLSPNPILPPPEQMVATLSDIFGLTP